MKRFPVHFLLALLAVLASRYFVEASTGSTAAGFWFSIVSGLWLGWRAFEADHERVFRAASQTTNQGVTPNKAAPHKACGLTTFDQGANWAP